MKGVVESGEYVGWCWNLVKREKKVPLFFYSCFLFYQWVRETLEKCEVSLVVRFWRVLNVRCLFNVIFHLYFSLKHGLF